MVQLAGSQACSCHLRGCRSPARAPAALAACRRKCCSTFCLIQSLPLGRYAWMAGLNSSALRSGILSIQWEMSASS